MKCDGKTLYLLQSTQSNGICDFCVAISTFTFNRMAYQRQWLHLRIESSDGSVRHTESSRLGRPLSCNGLEMQTNRFECCPWNEGREREKERRRESSARKIVHLFWSTAFVCVFSIRTPCLVEHSRQTFKFFHLFFFFFVRAAPVFHITFSLFSFFCVGGCLFWVSVFLFTSNKFDLCKTRQIFYPPRIFPANTHTQTKTHRILAAIAREKETKKKHSARVKCSLNEVERCNVCACAQASSCWRSFFFSHTPCLSFGIRAHTHTRTAGNTDKTLTNSHLFVVIFFAYLFCLLLLRSFT